MQLERLLRTKTGNGQELKNFGGNLFAHCLEDRMTSGPVKLGDDISDRVSDARDFR
jgi:hypothetical protein